MRIIKEKISLGWKWYFIFVKIIKEKISLGWRRNDTLDLSSTISGTIALNIHYMATEIIILLKVNINRRSIKLKLLNKKKEKVKRKLD